MAMLSARFHDAAAARQVREKFVNEMGATPDLVITTLEAARPGDTTDVGTVATHPTSMPSVDATRVSIFDNSIDADVAREALEAAGGVDIRPIQ